MKMKIKHDLNQCIGCGACTAVCPANWEMKTDNKAHPKDINITDDQLRCNKEAEQVCPVQCIKIE